MEKIDFEVLRMLFPPFMPPHYPITAPNIVNLLNDRGHNVTLYKVRKVLNSWRKKGFAEVKNFKIHSEYENYPPMKGWVMNTDNDIYKYLDRREDRLIKEIFGN